jgi:hypothetical protein
LNHLLSCWFAGLQATGTISGAVAHFDWSPLRDLA